MQSMKKACILATSRFGTTLVPSARASTLAERLKRAAVTTTEYESEEDQQHRLDEQVDDKGEPFRELFIMPKRKLNAQLQLERMTGRAEAPKFSRLDIHDRLAVRRPRCEEMSVDQDWPSVWPAAASYRSSVVPLPVRMGTRRYPEKRAPFKRVGNLELIKIPNFLHLTPEHVKRHCEAIKKFCTPFPEELVTDESLAKECLPVTVKYSDYVHQGTSLRDLRSRVNTVSVSLDAFDFDEHAIDKFRRLAGNRYDEATNTLTVVTDRCFTRKQNRDYAEYLLTALFYESKNVESWEDLKVREDAWKVEFPGSRVEQRIVDLVDKVKAAAEEDGPLPPVVLAAKQAPGTKKEDIVSHPSVAKFAETWYQYRNEKETPQSTRSYEERVRELLGIDRVSKSSLSRNQQVEQHSPSASTSVAN